MALSAVISHPIELLKGTPTFQQDDSAVAGSDMTSAMPSQASIADAAISGRSSIQGSYRLCASGYRRTWRTGVVERLS